jgi:inhibitor of KinA
VHADADVRIVAAGDAALLVEFPSLIDPLVNGRALHLARSIRIRRAAWIRDVVVGYSSVTVYFDPLAVDAAALENDLRECLQHPPAQSAEEGAVIEVPVCYGGEFGPDLGDVAASLDAREDDVVALHCEPTYRVYVVGFVPGFPYMARVHPRLALPRRRTPRTRVPAGSVAIAAGQTGIYPMETPGGWHLLGRTSVKPYDESRREPFLFRPGDLVRFHPVGRDEFERTSPWP